MLAQSQRRLGGCNQIWNKGLLWKGIDDADYDNDEDTERDDDDVIHNDDGDDVDSYVHN